MSSIAEQISANSKVQLENQLNFLNSVLKQTVDGAGQVLALNLHTARNAAERGAQAARQLIEAKDPREVLALARPFSAFEGLQAYGRELFTIASKAQTELLQAARDQFRDVPTLAQAVPALPSFQQAVKAGAGFAQAMTDGAAAAGRQAVEDTAAAAHTVADTAAQTVVETAQATTQAATEATEKAASTAVQAGNQVASQAVEPAAQAVAVAADTTDKAAQAASDNVEKAVEQVAAAVAETAPAASTAALFDSEAEAAPRNVRGKPAAKPVAEAVAALSDKPATTLKSVPGKPRK